MKQLLFFIYLLAIACQSNDKSAQEKPHENQVAEVRPSELKIHQDTTIRFTSKDHTYSVHIRLPDSSIRGSILLLHGYNLPPLQWCIETTFCTEALQRGYALIIPDMKRSNYSLAVYPETIEMYRNYPTLPWIRDSLLCGIEEISGLLSTDGNNFVAGISTGGRGASLLAYYEPERFTACASLSGDFDITKMQDSFLYQAWFGNYKEHTLRWENECIAYDCKNYEVPTYIAHGGADQVSPVAQSKMMFDSLNQYVHCAHHFPEKARHDYTFWGSETNGILDFFDEQLIQRVKAR
jgi:pimeloyl-ACP methyl ester carboxylesterase